MKRNSRPTKPSACVLYTRVSTTEQEQTGFSLDAQLSLLRRYAADRGMIVEGEYVDAQSGAKAGRKQFGAMVEFVRSRKIEAIVVEKTDRIYRNFHDLVLIDDTGADLHLVKEARIVGQESRSQDKFIHSVMASMAKYFSDNLREEVRKGMSEKARQGIFPSNAPIGYLNVRDGAKKTIAPDPDRAPLVRMLFEAYAAGKISIDGGANYARQIGLTTRHGRHLVRSSVARILDNPLYAGIVAWNGEHHAGIHEPIISIELWKRVQEVMHGRTTQAGYGRHQFAYRGLMTCAACGCTITAELKRGHIVYYRCSGAKNPRCPGKKVVREEVLTAQFEALFDDLTLPAGRIEWLKSALRSSLADEQEAREHVLRALEREEKTLRDRLERLYIDSIDGNVPSGVYTKLRGEWEERLAELAIKISGFKTAEVRYFDMGARILELVRTAGFRFKKATAEQKRGMLKSVISNCIMSGGKVLITPLEPWDSILKARLQAVDSSASGGENEIWYSGRDSNPRSSP